MHSVPTHALALMVISVFVSTAVVPFSATGASPPEGPAALVEKYDANRNGKIDVEERKGYLRERSKWIREEAARKRRERPSGAAATNTAPVSVSVTRERLRRFDANGNGRLEPTEKAALEADARKEAGERFKAADLNGDGRLDRQEQEAAVLRPSRR